VYLVRLANLGSAGSPLVGFSASIAFNGIVEDAESKANSVLVPRRIGNGPSFVTVSLTDMSDIRVGGDLGADIQRNAVREPVNLDGHNSGTTDAPGKCSAAITD